MAIALLLGGGAPNLTLMAGAVAALDEAGVKFDVVSTSGAGMLIGLLYAAPKAMRPAEALKSAVNMGVHDAIYNVFPVNYKVFHKPGAAAQAYTRFWQEMAQKRGEMEKLSRQWTDAALEAFLPGAALAPLRAVWQQASSGFAAAAQPDASTQRFFDDWAALMCASLCPSDLSPASLGMCQPAPFVADVVDFAKLENFPGEFYLSAYCVEDRRMALFSKKEITLEHFQAALAFPLIYAPFKLDGKTYLEGAAKDTLNFKGLYEYRKDESHPAIEAIVVCDVLGMDKLIGEPRNLYDAWVKSIIVPLTAIAKDDIKLFELVHKPHIRTNFGRPVPQLLKIDFQRHIPEKRWPNVLDWSHSNLEALFEIGHEAGSAFCADNSKHLF
jgi:NTE family protein